MTTAADDSAVEDAFEAILAGRPVPERAAGLAAFTGAVRASATEPGRPNAALAELLATGLLADQSSPSVRTARSAGSAPERRPSRVRIRRRSTMILPALIAKFLSAGAIAQAATGATVAVVAFTGVGAVGALPDPVQDTFATVVAEITPLEPPTSEEPKEEVVPEVAPEEAVVEDVETTDDTTETTEDAEVVADVDAAVRAWVIDGPTGDESISTWMSKAPENANVKDWLRARGMNFGNVVSAHASGKGFSDEELKVLEADLDEPVDAPTEPVTDDVSEEVSDEVSETDDTEVAATKDSGSRGNGKGNDNGNGGGNGRGNAKN